MNNSREFSSRYWDLPGWPDFLECRAGQTNIYYWLSISEDNFRFHWTNWTPRSDHSRAFFLFPARSLVRVSHVMRENWPGDWTEIFSSGQNNNNNNNNNWSGDWTEIFSSGENNKSSRNQSPVVTLISRSESRLLLEGPEDLGTSHLSPEIEGCLKVWTSVFRGIQQ